MPEIKVAKKRNANSDGAKKENSHTMNIENLKKLVLDRLGKPKLMTRLHVHPIADKHYRVNIWCEKENQGNKLNIEELITDSFFIKATDEAGILVSYPNIRKKY